MRIVFRVVLIAGFIFVAVIGCTEVNVTLPCDEEKRAILIAGKDSFELSGIGWRQSMVFYRGKVFSFTPLTCDIYELNTFDKVGTLSLPSDGFLAPHANCACLGKERYTIDSVVPALYLSAWNNGRQAFVYDISSKDKHYECSLLQVIDPNNVTTEIIGEGNINWVVDVDGGYIYSISYHLKGSSQLINGNYTHVVKYALPSLETKSVLLKDEDVLDAFTLPVMPFFQDAFYQDGYIYMVAGHSGLGAFYSPCLYIIDIKKRSLTQNSIPISGEPEGLSFYENTKWLSLYGSSKVLNLDNYLKKN